ncbi:MAG: glycosyltransferase family 4 protein [Thermodesulfobacteriota bacterium]
MRILLANYRYFLSSGPERYMFGLMDLMAAAGHECVPFSVRYARNRPSPWDSHFVPPLAGEDEVYFDQHRWTPRSALRTMSRLFYSPEVAHAARRLAREARPQAAYLLQYLRKLSPSLAAGLKRSGLPVVARLSDFAMLCPQAHLLRRNRPCTLCVGRSILPSVLHGCVKNSRTVSLVNALATWLHNAADLFRHVDCFVTPSRFMRDTMLSAGYAPDRIRHIPTFVDSRTFRPCPKDSEPERIVFVGRLDRPKGLEILVRAAAELKAGGLLRGRRIEIAGQGDQDYVRELTGLAATLRLTDAELHFAGHIPTTNLPAFLGGALCSVLPSLWFENLPNAALESMACGTPVVASNLGSLAECVDHGRIGLLFAPGDHRELAQAIASLLDDRPGLAAMSEACCREVRGPYAPERHLASLLDLFGELA